eukprot:m.126694 g.126694  ORF g.126694 m.126694 type:complete len:692 (-) comp11194_c0_seq4:242-2317(-)
MEESIEEDEGVLPGVSPELVIPDSPSTPGGARDETARLQSPLARVSVTSTGRRRSAERAQRDLLAELGFYGGGREALKAASDRTFLLLAGSVEDGLPMEKYVEYVRAEYGVTTRAAAACFRAADLDDSGLLNRHEFLLANDAFYHDKTPQHDQLLSIRATAVFLTFADSDGPEGEAVMTGAGFLRMVDTMCKCPSHTAGMMKALVVPDTDSTDPSMGLDEAMAAVGSLNLAAFQDLFCSHRFVAGLSRTRLSRAALLDKLFKGGTGNVYGLDDKRVVLDDRHEFSRSDDGVDAMRIASVAVPHDAVNPHLELDPRLRVETDWRGPFAAERGTDLFTLASNIIDVAVAVAHLTFTEAPTRDSDWNMQGEILEKMLGPTDACRAEALVQLAAHCQVEVARQPTVVRVRQPVKVFGDIHGQLRDLLLLFREFGMPTHRGGDIECVKYVFNGDFVDRGAHQIEVVALLFALKIMYPARVFLIRGNHEFRDVNTFMELDGFKTKVDLAFEDMGPRVFESVHQCFDWLPLACLVEERVLVLHGGIGAGQWAISDLEAVQRPVRDLDDARADDVDAMRRNQMVLEALWSDPSDSDEAMRRGVHWGNRGSDSIPEFGPDVTETFCTANGIDVVVRSHQWVARGYKVMHGGHLLTVFSARNYFDVEDNDGALLLIAEDAEAAIRIRPKALLQTEEDGTWA